MGLEDTGDGVVQKPEAGEAALAALLPLSGAQSGLRGERGGAALPAVSCVAVLGCWVHTQLGTILLRKYA